MEHIRQPIVTVAGHVDHGKTTILDSVRKTSVQEKEVGGITQHISFTQVPISLVKERCSAITSGSASVDIPGFLFIDTPGHAAFSHLRKRGGSLADLAIVVIDIREGIKPQTAEVLSLLKLHKIPFVIAMNKIDSLSGWKKQSENSKENVEKQSVNTKAQFDEKVFTLMGALHHHGFSAKLFYDVSDFTKHISLVPCSGKTGEGISDLLLILCGLSQKFLRKQLTLGSIPRGIILELKKEKSMQYVEAILYDGTLSVDDKIAIASFDEPIIAKIRVLEEIQPVVSKFKPVSKAVAANGIRMQLVPDADILPGMPFMLFDSIASAQKEFKKDIGDVLTTDDHGVIIKADSLGSLEALVTLLREKRIPILKADIGPIRKKDVISAQAHAQSDPEHAIILGFNVSEDEEVADMLLKDITILKNDVIYRLIDELMEKQETIRKQVEKEKLMHLSSLSVLTILPTYVFRNSHPAVFGVRVDAGLLRPHTTLIDDQGEVVGKIKDIQENQQKIKEAGEGKEVAISLPGVTFDRQLSETKTLFSDMSEFQFRKFKEHKDLLKGSEMGALQKIAQIKRKAKTTWGI